MAKKTLPKHTLVDLLELGNDVQANVGEVILKHLEEHGKQMGNGPISETD